MRYFTSDLHFNHPFVAATRGFIKGISDIEQLQALRKNLSNDDFAKLVDIEAYNAKLIKNINSLVGKDDHLYVLGDISTGNTSSFIKALEEIDKLYVPRSHRHLILGNHEQFFCLNQERMKLATERFAYISLHEYITIDSIPVILSHVPRKSLYEERLVSCFNDKDKRIMKYAPDIPLSIANVHGHTHSKDIINENSKSVDINICLDAWNLKPVREDELLKLLVKNKTFCNDD